MGWTFIAVGLVLTFVEASVPQSRLAAFGKALEVLAEDISKWLMEPGKEQQRCLLAGLGGWALIAGGIWLFGLEHQAIEVGDLMVAAVTKVNVNPIWEFLVVIAAPALALLALLALFTLLCRIHQGGALGVVGLVLDLSEASVDLGALLT
jgi:hypothetical protein